MSGLKASANQDKAMLGIGLMLGAYFCFSLIDTGAKWLALIGLSSMQLAFMRYFGHFFITLFLIGRGGWSVSRFGSDHLGLVVLRAGCLMFSTVMNFIAIRYLPLTLTSTILFSAPILICALSWPLLGERVGVWRWGAIVLGFAGIVVAIRPFDESFHWAVFLSLAGASSFALYSILTRKLSGKVATDTMQFYSGFVGFIVLLPIAVLEWKNPSSTFEWVVMLSLGLSGWFGHELLTRAHGFASASTLTPYAYSFILYLTVWSFFIFDHLPDQWTIIGAAIIIVAGLIIWFRESHLSKTKSFSVGN